MAYATRRCMCHAIFKQPFDVDPVVDMVRHVYAGRAVFHCGCSTVAPGLDLHWVGGHSDGLQIVRVRTARGSVVLASDAAHYYANMRKKNPFPLVYNVGDLVQGWQTVATLAEDETYIVRCCGSVPDAANSVEWRHSLCTKDLAKKRGSVSRQHEF